MQENQSYTDRIGTGGRSQTQFYLDLFTTSLLERKTSHLTLEELSSFDDTLTAVLNSIREERAYRKHINAKLSPELLMCIFEHVLAAPPPTSEILCDHQISMPDCRSLIAVTHVCRRWRANALECSTLWSSFISSAEYKLAEICSERARAVPLTVYAVVDMRGNYPPTEKRTLRGLIPRVRTLHLHIACLHHLRMFKNILKQATPAHTPSIHIRLDPDLSHHHGVEPPGPLFGGDDDLLRSLTLDYAWNWPLPRSRFSQLTELRLVNHSPFTSSTSVCAMLEMLAGMPVLETLLIRDADQGETELGHYEEPASGPSPLVRLPRLRRLTVALWNASSTLCLRSRLAFPDDTVVHLAAFWSPEPAMAGQPTPYTGECYAQVVLRQAVSAINILSASNARSTIEFGIHEPENCDVSQLGGIRAGLATVDVLRVEGIAQTRRAKTHDVPLDRLMGHMPALTHLSLRDYRGNVIPRLAALLASTSPRVLCPTLAAITLSILAPRLLLADLHPLLSATELRAERGFPLSRLTICTPLHSGTHTNDVSLYNVHGLKWLSLCSRDLFYGGGEERGDASPLRPPIWTENWPALAQVQGEYEDLWSECEDAGRDASQVVLRHVGDRYVV